MVFTLAMPHEKNSRNPGKNGPRPGPGLLDALLRKAGLRLGSEQVQALWTFHTFLRERNTELNMTRIHNFENIVLKHFVDSILVAGLVDLPSRLLDIGSGAGFPGIPLKIARPDIHIVMAEGRARRVEFLKQAVDLLGLEGIDVYGHKVGRANNPAIDLNSPFDGVITRALEDIPSTLRRVFDLLTPQGRVFFMKGPDCSDEIEEASRLLRDGYTLTDDIAYSLPGSPHRRRLVAYERKAGKTLIQAGGLPEEPGDRESCAGESAFPGRIKEITSPANPSFKEFASLLTSRGIRKAGQLLIAGGPPVAEVLEANRALCRGWITPTGEAAGHNSRIDRPRRTAPGRSADQPPPEGSPDGLVWYRLAPPLFRELDISGTRLPLLLADLPPMPDWSDREWPEGCTLFVPFQDPENVGAVIRAAAAFGTARVVLLAEAAHPFLPKSQRAAGSALFHVPLLRGPSIQKLAVTGAPLLILDAEGKNIAHFLFPRTFGLLAGQEGPGLPDRYRGPDALAIPMEPGAESLNAASSVAVALFAWRHSAGAPPCR
jgi:16S rRNA (guanine(527)-N(7))-methyltransferase RsmG